MHYRKRFDLYLVTDEKLLLGRDLLKIVESVVKGGVTMVQLREKDTDTRKFVHQAQRVHELLQKYQVPLIINDRVDVAIAIGAEGVHVGQSDMPVEYVRKIVPKHMMVGLSVENMEQAMEAENFEVDYLGVSPIFTTPTKAELIHEWGIDGLKELRAKSRHKLIAIGGINATNAAGIMNAGADGLAVVSAICSADNPELAAQELREIITKNKP